MPGIFISYRRSDSAGHAGRLCDALVNHFGADRVFMDVDDIRPGENFIQKLDQSEHSCSVLLAVIGKSWLSPRLEDPQDFVRREIASGLQSKLRVFPILVQGASMPPAEQLPAEIAGLSHLQAYELQDARFQRDAADLIALLDPLITSMALPLWAGTWQANVTYGWGATHLEKFDFQVDDDELLGTASYVGIARPITEGKVTEKKISFVTKSLTALDDKTYEEKHAYSGKLVDGKIVFRLQTDSGYDSRLPETFTAARMS
jgi:hypothetical protein